MTSKTLQEDLHGFADVAGMLSTLSHTHTLWAYSLSNRPRWVRRASGWPPDTPTGERERLGLQKAKKLT